MVKDDQRAEKLPPVEKTIREALARADGERTTSSKQDAPPRDRNTDDDQNE